LRVWYVKWKSSEVLSPSFLIHSQSIKKILIIYLNIIWKFKIKFIDYEYDFNGYSSSIEYNEIDHALKVYLNDLYIEVKGNATVNIKGFYDPKNHINSFIGNEKKIMFINGYT